MEEMSEARDRETEREEGFVTGVEAIGLEERGGGDRTGRIGKPPGMETSQKSKGKPYLALIWAGPSRYFVLCLKPQKTKPTRWN